VSAAVAVPAYAGIPLTQRGVASSFAVVTGHEEAGRRESSVDWARLARSVDTLVILMGVASLPRIADTLIAHGRPASTPVALVRWGTTDVQETLTGTLGDIARRAARVRLEPPVVIVIGDVVALRDRLQWFADNSLDSRPGRGSSPATAGGAHHRTLLEIAQ
jgi:uroporphyrinogen III methyltransferase/synthase